jgi:hypothetical protein
MAPFLLSALWTLERRGLVVVPDALEVGMAVRRARNLPSLGSRYGLRQRRDGQGRDDRERCNESYQPTAWHDALAFHRDY